MPRLWSMFMLASLAAQLAGAVRAPAAAQPGITLESVVVYDTAQPAAGRAAAVEPATFSYKQTQRLGLHVTGQLDGAFTKQQKLNVFAALKDSTGLVLEKIKDESWIAGGGFVRDFPELLACGEVLGRQDYSVELEVSVKGFAPVQQVLHFRVDGVPRPDVAHVQLRLLDRDGNPCDGFDPGARFSAQCDVDLRGYQGTLAPELLLLGELPGGGAPRGARDIARAESAESGAVLKLRLAPDGKYRVTASGDLPDRFSDPAQDTHAFRVYAVLRLGRTALDADTALGVVRDSRSERDRRKADDYGLALDDSDAWSIREL